MCQNLTETGKKILIDVIIKNMKSVYKSMNTDKITDANFNSVFEQFKKFSISTTSPKANVFSFYMSFSFF